MNNFVGKPPILRNPLSFTKETMPFCIVKTGVVLGQFFFAFRGIPINNFVRMKICPRVHDRSNKLPG